MAEVDASTLAILEPPPCAVRTFAAPQPMQVSILSCSPDEAERAFQCGLLNAMGEVRAVDCGKWYGESASPVDEQMGKSIALHRTIIGSPFFVTAMKECVEQSMKGAGLQIRVRPTYVSHVLAKMEADALNTLRATDGRRAFNARVHCLHEKTQIECRETIEQALKWLDEDGCRHLEPDDEGHRFGYAALLIDTNLAPFHRQNMEALMAQKSWHEWGGTLTTYGISIAGTAKIVNTDIDKIMTVSVTGPITR